MKKRGALKKIKLQAPCYSLLEKVVFLRTLHKQELSGDLTPPHCLIIEDLIRAEWI